MKRSGPIPTEASAATVAAALALSERRVSAVKGEGRLPVTPSGAIDVAALLRLGWQACLAGAAQRDADGLPREVVARYLETVALVLEAALREVAPSVVLAAAEAGIPRDRAELVADLAALLAATALQAEADPAGLRDLGLPHPTAWRATVAWDALYGPDGRSLVTGQIARESAAEMAEAGGD